MIIQAHTQPCAKHSIDKIFNILQHQPAKEKDASTASAQELNAQTFHQLLSKQNSMKSPNKENIGLQPGSFKKKPSNPQEVLKDVGWINSVTRMNLRRLRAIKIERYIYI